MGLELSNEWRLLWGKSSMARAYHAKISNFDKLSFLLINLYIVYCCFQLTFSKISPIVVAATSATPPPVHLTTISKCFPTLSTLLIVNNKP